MRPCVILLMAAVALGQSAYSPPSNCRLTRVSGQPYYQGDVYLSAHADTTALRALGFRNFAFEGRSVRYVKYHTCWPKNADLSALPTCVSGLNYDLMPQAQTIGQTLMYYGPDGKLVKWDTSKPIIVTPDMVKRSRSVNNRNAKEPPHGFCGGFDPNDLYIVPVEKVKTVPNMPRGTFMFMPVEGETIHKPENVGDKNSRNPGMFRLTPESTFEMTSLQRQYHAQNVPATGSTFQSSLPQGDQYWLRAGQLPRYQAISPSEYLRQQNRRRR